MKKIILASKSARRKEIMEKAGYDFVIIPSSFEISINNKNYNDELLKKCVHEKIEDVKNKIYYDNNAKYKNGQIEISNNVDDIYIVAADTVVVVDNKIIGKPSDRDDAISILKKLSNKTHFVATGVEVLHVSIVDKIIESINREITKTFVTFRKLSEEEIINYVEDKKPYDKAGSYGIQDEGFDFHIKVEGALDNVIGLPVDVIKKYIK